MRLAKFAIYCLLLSSAATFVAGCGGETDPSAGIPPEKIAPSPENLGDNSEYAKQFGGGKSQ